jgi:hypothetical protein
MENHPLLKLIDSSLQYLHELKKERPRLLPSHVILSESSTPLINPKPAPVEKTQDLVSPCPIPVKTIASPPQKSELTPIIEARPSVQAPTNKKSAFALHPPSYSASSSLQDLWTLLPKIAPSLTLLEKIPSDIKAQKIKSRWKLPPEIPEVPLLSLHHPALNFLHDVAVAIEKNFLSSKVLDMAVFEEKNTWDVFFQAAHLKLIVIPETMLWKCPNLARYYHEFPEKNERYLGKCPALVIFDPDLYLKDPSLKRSLWKQLCQALKQP